MNSRMKCVENMVCAGCLALGLVCGVAGAEEGYSIVTRGDASPCETFAAEELQTHLRLALGVDVPIVTRTPENGEVFELGTDRAKSVIGEARVAALRDEESIYVVKDGVVAIAGGGAAGLCYGVYT